MKKSQSMDNTRWDSIWYFAPTNPESR